MHTTYHNNRRGGHCPGHVRDTFLAAIDAFAAWSEGEPEPIVEFEAKYVPRQIPISKAAKLVWNCNDILPSSAWSMIAELVEDARQRTYASAARAMVRAIEASAAVH